MGQLTLYSRKLWKSAKPFCTDYRSILQNTLVKISSLYHLWILGYLSVLHYVPRVPSWHTCLCAWHAHLPYVPTGFFFVRDFIFFTCLTCHHFLRALRALIFLHALRVFICYVPYASLFCTCLHFYTRLHFIYVYANKTDTN